MTDMQHLSAWASRVELRTLDLVVAAEPCVPHSGWTHFLDLVMRGVLPHVSRWSWPVGESAAGPLEAEALRTGRTDGTSTGLVDLQAELDADVWVYYRFEWGELSIVVGSSELEALQRAQEWVRERVPESRPEEGSLPVVFWSLGSHGASRFTRTLEVPSWEAIGANYPAAVRARLEPLLAAGTPSESGKLLLWHGAPGAGKTHVVRALGWAWRGWCDLHYVTDPEEFFGRAGYMLEVLVNEDDDGEDRWRLLVLEDTGELLSADAKERTGQGLSRFLNVVDGILGQGLRLLVLVTTNESLRRLHPAVSRPGRCASAVEFTSFAADEAAEWLDARGLDPEHRPRTLAELYAKSMGRETAPDKEQRIGF